MKPLNNLFYSAASQALFTSSSIIAAIASGVNLYTGDYVPALFFAGNSLYMGCMVWEIRKERKEKQKYDTHRAEI